MKATLAVACAFALCAGPSASAQTLPSKPIVLAEGLLTLGTEITWSFAPEDPGFFNYTDYKRSALRMLRVDAMASVKAGDHLAILGDLRSENGDTPIPYALYARIRPWTSRAFDIQLGRLPPTFGAFGRRSYASDNPLIGYPLAYQYLTSLRPDSLPASTDELLQMRGRGWLSRFSVGNNDLHQGVPLVSGFRWDTGAQLHAAAGFVDATIALTTGTVSNPLFSDDNGGKQLAGRVELRPLVGLIVGGSAARGPFVSGSAAQSALGNADNTEFTQTAWGTDVEYSRDYYLVRFETIVSTWRLPIGRGPVFTLPLRAVATSVEGRYKIMPGLYAAGRFGHLGFSDVTGSTTTLPWDAPVSRFEVGGGYSLQRNLLLKISFQHNIRDGGRLPTVANLAAAQLAFWF